MNPAEPRQDSGREPPRRIAGGQASQRIAFGTAARAAGEVLSKPITLLFYIVMARELGEEEFGAFVFGLSLSTILLVLAGLGMQELVARDVARDHRRVDDLLWNVVVLKGLMMLVVLGVIAVVVTIVGYPPDTRLAILVISGAVALEYQTSTVSAVFQAYERQQYIATSLLVNRISTAALGIGALLAGWGLLAVSILVGVGSALGLVTAYSLMRHFVVRPRRRIDPTSWSTLTRTSLPLGVLTILSVTSLRSSVVLLGLLAVSAVEVGEYGAAFRLIEATLFISWSFSSALMPWFSRHSGSGRVKLGRGFEMGLKSIISIMLPLGIVLGLFAEPLIETAYGAEYSGAVVPLQVLAPITVLWGINGVISAVLIGRDRPEVYTVPAAATIGVSVVLSIILMPEYGALGASLTMVPSAVLLAFLTIRATVRLVGPISPLRIAIPPVLAGSVMVLATVLLSSAPWALAASLAMIAYAAAFLTVERLYYPNDFAFYARLTRFRKNALGPTSGLSG